MIAQAKELVMALLEHVSVILTILKRIVLVCLCSSLLDLVTKVE